jgi:hypothetical protein
MCAIETHRVRRPAKAAALICSCDRRRPHKSARFFVVGYFMGECEIRRDIDNSLSAAPCRDPPLVTACQSWYPDLLMRPSQASISRLAELKCCASLCFEGLFNGYIEDREWTRMWQLLSARI